MERISSDEEPNPERVLSDLPDGVIIHILSFLSTKSCVQTSVLAKRWRTLWVHVPVLDFYDWDFLRSPRKCFPSMVCAFMLRHKVQSLNYFRFTYNHCDESDDDDDDDANGDGPYKYEVETCIAVAVERNVQNLHLQSRLIVELPRCVFTCKTLVHLTMCVRVSIPPSGPIYLPNLKKLRLCYLRCEVDFTRLLSGCPVLEELIIERTKYCREPRPRDCYISSPTLKRLTIHHLLDRSMFDNPDHMVTINTPALRCLVMIDNCSYKHISISLCTSLVEADIYFDSLCEPADDFNHRCVLKLLDSIRNVKCLQLTGSCDKICDGLMLGPIAKFCNLTKLELCVDWRLLLKFLESADNLQVLTISEDSGDSEHWMDPVEERCACLSYSLRTVRIDGFRCTEHGFDMVRYILKNAQILERMEINCPRGGVDLKERFEAIRRISIFLENLRNVSCTSLEIVWWVVAS